MITEILTAPGKMLKNPENSWVCVPAFSLFWVSDVLSSGSKEAPSGFKELKTSKINRCKMSEIKVYHFMRNEQGLANETVVWMFKIST